jgi:hypothetical protein
MENGFFAVKDLQRRKPPILLFQRLVLLSNITATTIYALSFVFCGLTEGRQSRRLRAIKSTV